ncbi:MAG: DUF2145 domain-containing protein [Burkholderiaceae bacterium]|nr:DUF2145 domain-containing protein [Burkholderiaceae bacterium]
MRPGGLRAAVAALGLALGLAAAASTRAASLGAGLGFCEAPRDLSAAQRDRLLRFAALIRQTLEASGRSAVLVSRSGTDLSLFDLRYSHSGVALRASPRGAWSVRQLYFACEEQRPRLFDQGIAGFVFGSDDPQAGFVSLLLLPEAAADALAQTALDPRRALDLLAPQYSANAYAFSTAYQNCNQWVAELLAQAWSGRPEPAGPAPPALRRAAAQAWLWEVGYRPQPFVLPWAPLTRLAGWLPWLQHDDHPAEALAAGRFSVSMPDALEGFVRQWLPQAERLEFCHRGDRAVRRRGWEPLAVDCVPGSGDEVFLLD